MGEGVWWGGSGRGAVVVVSWKKMGRNDMRGGNVHTIVRRLFVEVEG